MYKFRRELWAAKLLNESSDRPWMKSSSDYGTFSSDNDVMQWRKAIEDSVRAGRRNTIDRELQRSNVRECISWEAPLGFSLNYTNSERISTYQPTRLHFGQTSMKRMGSFRRNLKPIPLATLVNKPGRELPEFHKQLTEKHGYY